IFGTKKTISTNEIPNFICFGQAEADFFSKFPAMFSPKTGDCLFVPNDNPPVVFAAESNAPGGTKNTNFI
ncbi:MAG: hypothetical protein D6714_13325, partial [Bacteroidetes bacterium]